MQGLLFIPFNILKFWYIDAPVKLFIFFIHLNKAFFNLSSLPLMIRTFFRPWKNEYRKGLIGFSIFMGIVFKSMFIVADLFIFIFLVLFEIIVFIAFLAWPILAFYLPFIKI